MIIPTTSVSAIQLWGETLPTLQLLGDRRKTMLLVFTQFPVALGFFCVVVHFQILHIFSQKSETRSWHNSPLHLPWQFGLKSPEEATYVGEAAKAFRYVSSNLFVVLESPLLCLLRIICLTQLNHTPGLTRVIGSRYISSEQAHTL